MRVALWPEEVEGEHRNEIDRFFAGDFPRWPWSVFLAEDVAGRAVGFAEVSVRPYAQGCRGNRVAYLEGWFVVPEARNRGVGRALVNATEEWGRSQGCLEFASDAESHNDVSKAAHGALGFIDVGLVRCFRKEL
jgi:aminoglycoside 6'-N-acetyltransferase I